MIALDRVTINAPDDPALARLWQAAMAKFGREPATREEARIVIQHYQRMLDKPRGIAAVSAVRASSP